MENYVKNQASYVCNNTTNNIAKSLAAPNTWTDATTDCYVGTSPSNNNKTGFTAVAAGAHTTKGIAIAEKNQTAYFWSASAANATTLAYSRKIAYNSAVVTRDDQYRRNAFSVRCVKDKVEIDPAILDNQPEDTIYSVSSVGVNTATIIASVTDQGGSDVTARGVCWSATRLRPLLLATKCQMEQELVILQLILPV